LKAFRVTGKPEEWPAIRSSASNEPSDGELLATHRI